MRKTATQSFFKNDKFHLIIILVLICLLFVNFFSRGYVLDGNHDRRETIIPLHYFQLKSLEQGTIPQWNPYILCGVSFLGNGFDLIYSPLFLLIYCFPEGHLIFLLTALMIIQLFMAGFFSYILFKRIGGDGYWALVGSVIYIFSSSSVVNMTVGNSCFAFIVYLPLWLLLIYTRRERSFLKNFVFTTVMLSVFILSGSWQRIMYTVWFVYLFIVFESFGVVQKRIKFDPWPLLINTLSLSTALAIAGVRLIPFIMNSEQGITTPVSFESALAYTTVPFEALFRFFAPEFLGMKLHEHFLFGEMPNVNHLETFNCYTGVTGGFLFLYILFFFWDRKTLFWKIASIGIILVIVAPPFTFIHYLLSRGSALNYGRLAWFIPICVGALVGIYGSSCMRKNENIRKLRIVSVILLVIVSVSLFRHVVHFESDSNIHIESINAMRWSLRYFLSIGVVLVLALFLLRFKILKYVLLVLLTFDLLSIAGIDANNSNPFLSPADSFKFIDAERRVAKKFEKSGRAFRIYPELSMGATINRCIQLGFYSPSGLDSFCSPYIARIYQGSYDLNKRRNDYARSRPKSASAFDLSSTALTMQPGRIRATVNPSFVPRVSLYTDYLVISDDRRAFDKVTMKGHNPASTLVVDRAPSLNVTDTDTAGTTRIIKEENEHILISTDSPTNSILLLTDTYHNGWKAYVDGKEREIMRGNYAFRAVCIPSGKHLVEFAFEHPGFNTSIVVSLTGLTGFLLLIILVPFGRVVLRRQKDTMRGDLP